MRRKTAGRVPCIKEKKNLLRSFHVSKKGKTADKVSVMSKVLTICYASNTKFCRKKKMELNYLHLAFLKYEVQKEFHHNFFQNLETLFHAFE